MLLLSCFLFLALLPNFSEGREVVPFNFGWRWFLGNPSAGPTPTVPPAAKQSFDDSKWSVVDAPHDALIATPYNESARNNQGSIPTNVTWYRKHIMLPSDWAGSHVEVYFEGVFSVVTAYFNDVLIMNHSCGYTSFAVRIDNITGVVWGGENLLAIYADATVTTGWWYEGGGIFRDVSIIRSPLPARLADDGAFAPAFTEGEFHTRATPADGMTVDSATLVPSISIDVVVNNSVGNISTRVTLFTSDGLTPLGSSTSMSQSVSSQTTIKLAPPPLTIANVELWTIARPYLHVLFVELLDATQAVVDTKNITVGVRSVRWDAINGVFINEQHVKLRGFCNHNNFAAVGVGVPLRVNLLRLQQLRGMGANGWRMSHNPGSPSTFELGDRLGMTFLDENRIFKDDAQSVTNMGDMVRRDRVHPSILYYSFCNEVGCSPGTQPALDFKIITESVDGSRAVTMNYFLSHVMSTPNATVIIDIQGFSHQTRADFIIFHEKYPEKPILATECCSCVNQRDEDSDIDHTNTSVTATSNTGSCQASQTNASDGIAWAAGTMVWTAMDYYGEPGGWPHISSRFGQFDLAGFSKAPAFWFRQNWLSSISLQDAGRPPVSSDTTVRLVELWQPPSKAGVERNINVYSNAPYVRVSLNGVTINDSIVGTNGVFNISVPYQNGTLTADGLASDKATVLASHSRSSWLSPSRIVLSIDAPNILTGTGSALYLDGSDVALVRATIIDEAGHVVEDSTLNITFSVSSGPGLIVGCGNGDPANQDPNDAVWKPAYHGLVRTVVRTTLDAASPDAVRARRIMLDVDAGKGPRSSAILPIGGIPPTTIIVTASSPGLPLATLTIPLSVDIKDSPLAVAAASVGLADTTTN